MKISWGTAIAIFYSLFVLAMVGMVIKSSQNKMDLVQENYYQKDLDYEDFRSRRQNATELTEQVEVHYSATQQILELSFPEEMQASTGKLVLFRPSNKQLDQSFDLVLDQQAKMSIPLYENTTHGLWKVQIEWEIGGRNYYKEKAINL